MQSPLDNPDTKIIKPNPRVVLDDQPETVLVDILNEKHKLLINVSDCDKIET